MILTGDDKEQLPVLKNFDHTLSFLTHYIYTPTLHEAFTCFLRGRALSRALEIVQQDKLALE